ncbi:MAG: RIP metalloprotease RseP [Treponema sp.]|nr:RIP metalloprotease RseP [Candidatus Treponema caballi]
MTFVYGIIGLGLIVIIHEFGHFCASKMMGVKVEAFSVGMGPVLLHKEVRGVDWRLSLFPIGGYCAMKGENAFQEALDSGASEIQGEPDSFYGVSPLKRAFIAFNGPFFNVIFAFVAFVIISAIGYSYYTTGNRVILADEIYPDMISVAGQAGLKTGDYIISIDKHDTPDFSEISQYVSLHADEDIVLHVERNGDLIDIPVHTLLDTSTGAGKIGIVNWVDPIIETVTEGSRAAKSGLLSGDTIRAADGVPVQNVASLSLALADKNAFTLTVERDGSSFEVALERESEDEILGVAFHINHVHTKKYSFFGALWQGVLETGNMIGLTFKSISLLFKGVDLSSAVSGPVRITKMLGETAIEGFTASFSTGVITVLNFLALISISLFIMNLLPIPILDGGLLLFALIETFSGKKIHPKFLYYVQFVGLAFIFVLFGIALFSDMRYLFG